jgi:gliding motility-associated-like protein
LNDGALAEDRLSYTWANTSTISSQPSVAVTEAGQYALTVENMDNGCISMDFVAVGIDTISPVATIAPVDELNCTVTSLDLNASGSAMPAASYAWTTVDGQYLQNNATTNSSVNTAGTYALRILNPNGCSDSTSLTVGIDTVRPVITLPAIEALTCQTPERNILSAVSGGQGASISYQWSHANEALDGQVTNPALNIDRPGLYSLLVTNETNTCQGMAEFNVEIDTLLPLLAALLPDTINCLRLETQPNPVILSGRPTVIYDWATLSGPQITTGIAMPLVTAGGIFELTVTDPINGCTSSAGWTVVQDTITPIINLPGLIDLGCDTLPVTVIAATGTAPYVFDWSTTTGTILNGQATAEVELMGPGIYSLSVENTENGCQATQDITLTQALLNGFAFELSAPNCSQEAGILTFGPVAGGIGPYLYSINDGETYTTDLVYRELVPNDYDLRVQDMQGCEVTLPVSVPSVRSLEIGLDDNFSLRQGDSVLLEVVMNFAPSEIDTIIWSTGAGLSCYDCLRPVARPLSSTTYEVEVISQDGCTARAQVQVLVDERGIIYVPNAFSPNGDGVNDLLAPLAAPHRVDQVRKFEIFDRWGNQVYRAEGLPVDGSAGGWDGKFQGSQLSIGAYIWWAEVEMADHRMVVVKGEVMILR